ncbi:uncharacterized protein BDZ83DRAFT_336112 [Colletotrichum acutatum]|uniref:Uncharacterized protein n=1 Tax=Glomerella acutata TaxID=27357 RepID=A0AAD8XP05_GLOAC|nr:uncharacterized protein BDZ83DRAFT_336112 [Colletotrichum acutatum]KAK1730803.1 hypothetical protein BDZ83DRAFT_336112 [Colletotrichum acutatum]
MQEKEKKRAHDTKTCPPRQKQTTIWTGIKGSQRPRQNVPRHRLFLTRFFLHLLLINLSLLIQQPVGQGQGHKSKLKGTRQVILLLMSKVFCFFCKHRGRSISRSAMPDV